MVCKSLKLVNKKEKDQQSSSVAAAEVVAADIAGSWLEAAGVLIREAEEPARERAVVLVGVKNNNATAAEEIT